MKIGYFLMVKMTICKIIMIFFSLCIYITSFYCIIANKLPVFNIYSLFSPRKSPFKAILLNNLQDSKKTGLA